MTLPTMIARSPVTNPSSEESSVTSVPDEERRRDEVRREPDREQPTDRAVAGRLGDRLHAVAFDREVALAGGHALAVAALRSPCWSALLPFGLRSAVYRCRHLRRRG